MMTRGRQRGLHVVSFSVCVLLVCACQSEVTGRPGVEVIDSAGVRIIDLGAGTSVLGASPLDVAPVYQVGIEGDDAPLFRVSGAEFLSDGGLAIANSGVPEVLVIGPTGSLVARLGDRGEGPGEFGGITSIHAQPDGSVVVYDDSQGRLTSFLGRDIVETRRMADPSSISDLIPLAASQIGPVLAILGDDRRFQQSGTRQDTTPLLRFSAESTVPDTLARWPARAWSFASTAAGSTRSLLPYGPDLLTSGNSDGVLLAASHSPEVHVLDRDGALRMLIRWTQPTREVTEDEYRDWRRTREQELSEQIPQEMREALLSPPPYDSHPVLAGALLAQDGVVWLAPSTLTAGRDQVWLRVSSSGVLLPPVGLTNVEEVLDAAGDRVAVLVRDALEAEIISVVRLAGDQETN